MEENEFKQKNLIDVFGTESVVSEVLHGISGAAELIGRRARTGPPGQVPRQALRDT